MNHLNAELVKNHDSESSEGISSLIFAKCPDVSPGKPEVAATDKTPPSPGIAAVSLPIRFCVRDIPDCVADGDNFADVFTKEITQYDALMFFYERYVDPTMYYFDYLARKLMVLMFC